jgi:hypothetical protein
VEWCWQGKPKNSEKYLSQCLLFHHKSHTDPGSNAGLRSDKPETNLVNYGTAINPLKPKLV